MVSQHSTAAQHLHCGWRPLQEENDKEDLRIYRNRPKVRIPTSQRQRLGCNSAGDQIIQRNEGRSGKKRTEFWENTKIC